MAEARGHIAVTQALVLLQTLPVSGCVFPEVRTPWLFLDLVAPSPAKHHVRDELRE